MRLLTVLATIVTVWLTPASAQSVGWPPKAVRIVVPFGPGSTPDIVARLLADSFKQTFPGSTFVVENKPGASGNIGTEAVAKAAPDGSTIGVSIGGPLATNRLLFTHLNYQPARDLAPVTELVTQASALVVNSSLGVDSVAGLIELLRKNPGKYSYASIGVGSLSHLTMEAIALKADARLAHVPLSGSPAAVMEVLRGDAPITCLPAIAVEPQLESGKLKILAVSTPTRSRFLPNTPTLKESGIDVEADTWMGLVAPAGLPPEAIQRLHDAAVAAMTSPDVRAKLELMQMDPVGNTPEQFRDVIATELKRWRPVISAANIHLD